MEALHRQIFESFGRACPTSPCGLYILIGSLFKTAGACPKKRRRTRAYQLKTAAFWLYPIGGGLVSRLLRRK